MTVIFGRLTFDKRVEGIPCDTDTTHDESVWPVLMPNLTQKEEDSEDEILKEGRCF